MTDGLSILPGGQTYSGAGKAVFSDLESLSRVFCLAGQLVCLRLCRELSCRTMDKSAVAFWLTVVGTICWGVCFWWMHRISAKQNYLLDRLREQAKRIESLSQVEHDLIKEVHPQVGEIKEGVDEMIAVSKGQAEKDKKTS